jgi:uncharacterized protein YecE (DUF72 family)
VGRFVERVSRLGEKLGPILVQLPPHWHVNAKRLRHFIEILPPAQRYAFEFRHPSWYTEEIYTLLRDSGRAFCIHDHKDAPSPTEITADFAYVRFHGTEGGYHGSYVEETLREWAQRLADWQAEGIDAYVYFNNDWEAHAVDNARQLRALIEGLQPS